MDPIAQIIVSVATLITALAGAWASVMASRKAAQAVAQNVELEKKAEILEKKVDVVHEVANHKMDKLLEKSVALAEVVGVKQGRAEVIAEQAIQTAENHIKGVERQAGVEEGRAQVLNEQAVAPPEPGGVADVRVVDVADVRVVQLGPEKDKDKKQP